MKSIDGRIDGINNAIQHSKLRYILFRVFTDSNANHGYKYLTSDIYTSPVDLKNGSWDLTLGSVSRLRDGFLSPIFVEIKSSFNDSAILVKEIVDKIRKTELLMDNGEEEVILSQIAETGKDGLKIDRTNLEYVIFIPGRLSGKLVDYITATSKEWDNKTGVIVWAYDKKNADGDVIIIPYSHRPQVKTCRNMDKADCKLCLCVHGDSNLLNYLKNVDDQELELGRIMPSRHKYVDPVVNIISILSVGKLFKKTDKNLGEKDLIKRMSEFFHEFMVFPTQDELDYLFALMIRGKIILKTKGPFPSYHLNGDILDALGEEKILIEEVIKRAVKNKLPQTFLEQFIK